jgi:metal-dependent HD superfamily phosphatase/phosphodiesterase
MNITPAAKPARNRVDMSSEDMARLWCKRLKKSRLEIEAAIAKVGDNAQTVIKELGANQR